MASKTSDAQASVEIVSFPKVTSVPFPPNREMSIPSITSSVQPSRYDIWIKFSVYFGPLVMSILLCFVLLEFDFFEPNVKNVSLLILIFETCTDKMCILFVVYLIFFGSKNVRYFRALHGVFDGYAPVSMIYGIKEYPNHVVNSLGAFYQHQGTLVHRVSIVSSYSSLITIIIIILLNFERLQELNCTFTAYSAIVCKVGFLTATGFELHDLGENEYNKYFQIGHYFGAFLFCASNSFPILYMSNFNIIAIIMVVIGYIFLFVWVYMIMTYKKEYDDKDMVHKVSLKMIFCEICGIVIANILIEWYLYLIIVR